MKKIVSTLLSLAMLFTLSSPAFAYESTPPEIDEENIEVISNDSSVQPHLNDFRARKKDVTISYGWSNFKRVSDNLSTGSEGGTLIATKTVTFGTEISGSTVGLPSSGNASISSSIGYSLNVGPYQRVFMGYRVYYKIEKGTREFYDVVTGEILQTNKYTVKIPQYGEYALIGIVDV